MIDSHQHFWDPRTRVYDWMDDSVEEIAHPYGPADLREAMEGTPVTHSIVVQAVSDFGESLELLDVTADEDHVLGAVVWVDLAAEDVADRLAELREHRGSVVGIRHQVHDEADPDWLLRPQVQRGLAAVDAAGLVFDLLVRRRESEAAITVAERFPSLPLVLDHAGKPTIRSGETDTWTAWFRRLAAHDNVTCKLSGLVTEATWHAWRDEDVPAYAREIVAAFGPDRTMFGSDWPVSTLAASYSQVFELAWDSTADLTASERAAVFGETARRIYSLGADS